MDKEELQKNIALYYSKLPPKVQEFFTKMEWLANLEKICEKYGLDDNQKEVMGTEMTLLLLGIIHPVEFEENTTKELDLKTQVLEKFQEEIYNLILKNVQQDVLSAFNANKKAEIMRVETPAVVETPQTVEMNSSNTPDSAERPFENLPQKTEDIVKDSNYQTILYKIAQTHKLSVSQMDVLEIVTKDLITGAVRPVDFKPSLMKKLNLPETEATVLVDEITEKIFKKIREKMMDPDDLKVLKSHGIDIIPTTTDKEQMKPLVVNGVVGEKRISQVELPAVHQAPMMQVEKIEINAPKPAVHPLLLQKLSRTVQATTVKSQYGVNNVPVKTGEVSPATPPPGTKPSTYPKNNDPYRAPIE